MSSPLNSPLGSPDDIALNRAILESLRPSTAIQNNQSLTNLPAIPSPTLTAGTQFVPVQTTTTFIPVSNNQNRLPIVPPLRTTSNVPVIPTINTNPRVPIINTNPIVPSQLSTTNNVVTNQVPYIQPYNRISVPINPQPVSAAPRISNINPLITTTNNIIPINNINPLITTTSNITPIRNIAPVIPVTNNITPTRNPLIPINSNIPPIIPITSYVSPIIPVTNNITPIRNITPVIPLTSNATPIRTPLIPLTTNITPVVPIRNINPVVPIRNINPVIATTGNMVPVIPPLSPRSVTVNNNSYIPPRPNINNTQFGSRSPGRMTTTEEEQMRIAIMNSLQDAQSPINSQQVYNTNTNQEDIEDVLLQAAIQASMEATEQAKVATFHANQITAPSPILSPRTIRIQEDRLIREQQDMAYEEALRADREREDNIRLAAEAATKAAQAAEEATRKLQAAKLAEEAKKEAIQPPNLQYPIEMGSPSDIYNIRFRLPEGGVVNHSFNRNEPIRNIIQQLRFDIKHTGELTLTIPPRTIVNCSLDTPISACGFDNRILVIVALV